MTSDKALAFPETQVGPERCLARAVSVSIEAVLSPKTWDLHGEGI